MYHLDSGLPRWQGFAHRLGLGIFFVGVAFFAWVVINYISLNRPQAENESLSALIDQQRQAAIARARQQGQTSYSFRAGKLPPAVQP